MYCQHCGKQIKDGVRFCTHCGLPQELEATSTLDATQAIPSQSKANPIEPPLSVVPDKEPRRRRRWLLPVAVIAALALVAGASFGAWRLGLLEEALSKASETLGEFPFVSDLLPEESHPKGGEAEVDAAAEVPGSVGSGEASEAIGHVEEPEPKNEAASAANEGDAMKVRSSLSDYSWEELGQIAREIESCMTADDAQVVAKEYNLLDQSGRYTSATKDVRLADGKTAHMRLVGVWHDKADTASGRAGLTFLSDGIVMRRSMHSRETISGGWESSAMRSWLSGDFKRMLPSEVASQLIPAYKQTNNSGETRSASSVTETRDEIWLPSIVELCGPVDWEYQSNPSNSDLYNSIFNAEGAQFPAFVQEKVDDYAGNKIFSLGGEWWMRSTSPASGKGRYVGSDGDPSYYAKATEEKGVVVGFCL